MLSIDQPKKSHCLYAYVMWLGVKQSVFLWMKKTKLNESQNFLDVNDLHKGENGENRGKKLMYTKVQTSQKFDYNHFSKFKSWTNNKEKKILSNAEKWLKVNFCHAIDCIIFDRNHFVCFDFHRKTAIFFIVFERVSHFKPSPNFHRTEEKKSDRSSWSTS